MDVKATLNRSSGEALYRRLVKPEALYHSRRLVIQLFGKLLKGLDPGFTSLRLL